MTFKKKQRINPTFVTSLCVNTRYFWSRSAVTKITKKHIY